MKKYGCRKVRKHEKAIDDGERREPPRGFTLVADANEEERDEHYEEERNERSNREEVQEQIARHCTSVRRASSHCQTKRIYFARSVTIFAGFALAERIQLRTARRELRESS